MDWELIVNPASGGGKTGRRWPEIEGALGDHGIKFQAHFTTRQGEASDIARQILEGGHDHIAVLGGDGTMNEAVNGCFNKDGKPSGPRPTLALLPAGTGGDFARTLNVKGGLHRNAELLRTGTPRPCDVGAIEYSEGTVRYFINIADCGLGGEVVNRVNASTAKRGGLRGTAVFFYHSMAALVQHKSQSVNIELEGSSLQRQVMQVVVANGQSFGAGMRIAPDAEIDDGQFDVIIINEMPLHSSLLSFPKLYRGHHLGHPKIEFHRTEAIKISGANGRELPFDVDGEAVGTTPARITCLRGAVDIVCPN